MLLGINWFRDFAPIMDWAIPTLTILCENTLPTKIRGGELGIPSLPLISNVHVKSELRRGASAAMIYVSQTHSHSEFPAHCMELFDKYRYLFMTKDLPLTLPPKRPEDHCHVPDFLQVTRQR